MSVKLCLVLLAAMHCTRGNPSTPHRKPAPKTNAVHHFDPHSLAKFVKNYKFVVVLHNQPKTKKGRSIAGWYFKLAKMHDVNEVFFLQVHAKTPKKGGQRFRPRVQMHVYGFAKSYHGDMNSDSLHHWITDIVQATPTRVTSVADISAVDSHYFVVISEAWLAANRTHLTVLAKLISPVNVFYGLDKAEVEQLTAGRPPTSPLWVYREYNKEVTEVDIHLPLRRKADFILNSEFPAFVLPSQESYRLVTEFKAPVLLYFTRDADDEFIDIVKRLAKPFKDYLITMAVVPDKKNKTSRFFMDFMGVSKLPALRILNMQEEVRRYMYMGELDPTLIEYFLQNYKRDNLKSYALSESVKRGETSSGFLKANHEMFSRLLNDRSDANLIYIYSRYQGVSREHLENLEVLQSVFRENKNFKVYLLNHDKNDLDGYFRQKLPVLILTTPAKQVHHFEGAFDFTSLANFIISKLPHMKLAEPEFADAEPVETDL